MIIIYSSGSHALTMMYPKTHFTQQRYNELPLYICTLLVSISLCILLYLLYTYVPTVKAQGLSLVYWERVLYLSDWEF